MMAPRSTPAGRWSCALNGRAGVLLLSEGCATFEPSGEDESPLLLPYRQLISFDKACSSGVLDDAIIVCTAGGEQLLLSTFAERDATYSALMEHWSQAVATGANDAAAEGCSAAGEVGIVGEAPGPANVASDASASDATAVLSLGDDPAAAGRPAGGEVDAVAEAHVDAGSAGPLSSPTSELPSGGASADGAAELASTASAGTTSVESDDLANAAVPAPAPVLANLPASAAAIGSTSAADAGGSAGESPTPPQLKKLHRALQGALAAAATRPPPLTDGDAEVEASCAALEGLLSHRFKTRQFMLFTVHPFSFVEQAERLGERSAALVRQAATVGRTDGTRLRAWLYLHLNRRSLAQELEALTADEAVVGIMYHPDAVLASREWRQMAVELLRPLSGIAFRLGAAGGLAVDEGGAASDAGLPAASATAGVGPACPNLAARGAGTVGRVEGGRAVAGCGFQGRATPSTAEVGCAGAQADAAVAGDDEQWSAAVTSDEAVQHSSSSARGKRTTLAPILAPSRVPLDERAAVAGGVRLCNGLVSSPLPASASSVAATGAAESSVAGKQSGGSAHPSVRSDEESEGSQPEEWVPGSELQVPLRSVRPVPPTPPPGASSVVPAEVLSPSTAAMTWAEGVAQAARESEQAARAQEAAAGAGDSDEGLGTREAPFELGVASAAAASIAVPPEVVALTLETPELDCMPTGGDGIENGAMDLPASEASRIDGAGSGAATRPDQDEAQSTDGRAESVAASPAASPAPMYTSEEEGAVAPAACAPSSSTLGAPSPHARAKASMTPKPQSSRSVAESTTTSDEDWATPDEASSTVSSGHLEAADIDGSAGGYSDGYAGLAAGAVQRGTTECFGGDASDSGSGVMQHGIGADGAGGSWTRDGEDSGSMHVEGQGPRGGSVSATDAVTPDGASSEPHLRRAAQLAHPGPRPEWEHGCESGDFGSPSRQGASASTEEPGTSLAFPGGGLGSTEGAGSGVEADVGIAPANVTARLPPRSLIAAAAATSITPERQGGTSGAISEAVRSDHFAEGAAGSRSELGHTGRWGGRGKMMVRRIYIANTEMREVEGRLHAVYLMKCRIGPFECTTFRRFSEFMQLHGALKRANQSLKMPTSAKRMKDCKRQLQPLKHTEERVALLQSYCLDLCGVLELAQSPILIEFCWPSSERGDGVLIAPDGSEACMT